MGSYKVVINKSAKKEIIKLPSIHRKQVIDRIDRLKINPRPRGCEKIKGSKNSFRIRIGDYRVLYVVYDSRLIVSVLRAQHRKEVYRNL